jgi:hypothetical protein
MLSASLNEQYAPPQKNAKRTNIVPVDEFLRKKAAAEKATIAAAIRPSPKLNAVRSKMPDANAAAQYNRGYRFTFFGEARSGI